MRHSRSFSSPARPAQRMRTRGFELGAIDYIHKPLSPLVVQARVRTHLALREAREQLAEEKRKVDRLLEEAERLFGLIFDYAARMSAEADPDKLLRLNADMARDLVRADRCSIWLRDVSTGELWTKVAHGLPERPNCRGPRPGRRLRRYRPADSCERHVQGSAFRS